MIKFYGWNVWGFEGAIKGMRLPYGSWIKSDSYWASTYEDDMVFKGLVETCWWDNKRFWLNYTIGENDMKLAMKLANAGTDHGKFLRMIHVQANINAPLYWWKQLDTYKVGTVANSSSTMHTIAKKEFELDDFSTEHLSQDVIDMPFQRTIDCLNLFRSMYLQSKDKEDWYTMIQLLPSSYNQTRMLDLNYQTLRAIYFARQNHKLDEWRDFCDWIEGLPYSELITGEKE